ncbi:MAG: nucleotidyltransferase family protein [Bacteroidales bacterium]|nr:nucleotidyltransferase family protein [Bacteroidales bacterium]
MEAAERTYLILLKEGLWAGLSTVRQAHGGAGSGTGSPVGELVEPPGPVEGPALNLAWRLARMQATRGVVGQALLDSGVLSPEGEDAVSKRVLEIVANNLKLEKALAKSVGALREAGIEPVLLKGQGVASCYPQPLIRECGDIDLYVGKENYRKAFEVLSALSGGLNEEEFKPKSKHSHVEIEGIPVEAHQFSDALPPRYDRTYQEISDRCLSDGFVTLEFSGVPVRTPEPTFHAFFLFNHLWRHFFTEGVGFRQVCDWTMYLHVHKDSIDLNRLQDILESLDITTPWKVFGNIAVEVLGLPAEEMPFHEPKMSRRIGKVVRMMLKEGNFGHERKDWYELDRTSVWGLVKVFLSISRRYLGLFPVFGPVVLREYSARIRRRIARKD